MNRRLALVSLTVAVATLIVAPTSAEAKRKPSQRARVHALETQMKRLKADLKKATAALVVATEDLGTAQENIYEFMDYTDGRLECMFVVPIDAQNYTPPDAVQPFEPYAVFNWSTSATPTLWMSVVHPSCVPTAAAALKSGKKLIPLEPRVGTPAPR